MHTIIKIKTLLTKTLIGKSIWTLSLYNRKHKQPISTIIVTKKTDSGGKPFIKST